MALPLEIEVPDERPNLLRPLLEAAENAAGSALSELGAVTGNPLAAMVLVIEDSWTAEGSLTRTNFIADVLGAGAGVRSAFSNAQDDLQAQVAGEAVSIDVTAHPDQEWKTDDWGISSRVNAPYRGGY